MSEKEKMQQGKLYDASDEQIQKEMKHAKELCFELNHIHPRKEAKRFLKLQELIPTFDETCHIEPPFFCDYGKYIRLKKHVYFNHNVTILDGGGVTIGNHVFIGPNVCLTTAGHPQHAGLRKRYMEYAYPIVIEDHVWIGANVVINPGVTIKEGAIIGSGSVVTHDIDAYVIACGVPCETLRTIADN